MFAGEAVLCARVAKLSDLETPVSLKHSQDGERDLSRDHSKAARRASGSRVRKA